MKQTYVFFTHNGKSPSGKTDLWSVYSDKNEHRSIVLGEIRWFGRWRRYCFYPVPDRVFDATCLRQIAAFTETRTSMLRATWHSK